MCLLCCDICVNYLFFLKKISSAKFTESPTKQASWRVLTADYWNLILPTGSELQKLSSSKRSTASMALSMARLARYLPGADDGGSLFVAGKSASLGCNHLKEAFQETVKHLCERAAFSPSSFRPSAWPNGPNKRQIRLWASNSFSCLFWTAFFFTCRVKVSTHAGACSRTWSWGCRRPARRLTTK